MLPAVLALPGAVAAAVTVLTFADPAITESSGLVATPEGWFVTVNDSGDTGRVFVVDRQGRTIGTTTWPGDPRDVEALAPAGPDAVWVGDIGDNTGSRASVSVRRVEVGRGDRRVAPPAYELVYPDGPHDAETLLADPRSGRLLVVTKSLLGGTVYAAPPLLRADRPNRLRPVADSFALATDGAFLPDGRHYVVRGYAGAAVYTYPGHDRVASLPLPAQRQGEGLAVGTDGALYLSSEGEHAPLLRMRLPARVRAALAPPSPTPSRTPSRTPSPTPESAPTTATEEGAGHGLPGGRAGGGLLAVLGAAFVAGLGWLLLRRGQAP